MLTLRRQFPLIGKEGAFNAYIREGGERGRIKFLPSKRGKCPFTQRVRRFSRERLLLIALIVEIINTRAL